MYQRRLILLLALLLSFLSLILIKEIHKPLYVYNCHSDKFPQQCVLINEALSKLNNECNNCVLKVPGYPVSLTIDLLDSDTLGVARVGVNECNIIIDPRNSQGFYMTLIHEIGHCKGYDHVDDPTDVMYYQESDLVTEDKVNEFIKKL